MAIAVTIDDTIEYSFSHVQTVAMDVAQSLRAQLTVWASTFAQFDEEIEAQRTVRNWEVPTNLLIQQLPLPVGLQLEAMNEAWSVVWQACCAAKYAEIDGRITALQLAQVVADWNTAWGYL